MLVDCPCVVIFLDARRLMDCQLQAPIEAHNRLKLLPIRVQRNKPPMGGYVVVIAANDL